MTFQSFSPPPPPLPSWLGKAPMVGKFQPGGQKMTFSAENGQKIENFVTSGFCVEFVPDHFPHG